MTKLYSSLASVYHEMYKSIFDYKDDFQAYHKVLKKHKCKKILEIGCGTGNLASYFLNEGYKYVGADLSEQMLSIARSVEPKAKFVVSDMRKLDVPGKYDAVLITGRSITHLLTNKDILDTFSGIRKKLRKNGLLMFDNFDAELLFSDFKKRMVNSTRSLGTEYKRTSVNTLRLDLGWVWNWKATYEIKKKGRVRIVKDECLLRAYTPDEIRLLLKMRGFNVLKLRRREHYLDIVAEKI